MVLTEEQKRRIEEKKAEALAKRQNKQNCNNPGSLQSGSKPSLLSKNKQQITKITPSFSKNTANTNPQIFTNQRVSNANQIVSNTNQRASNTNEIVPNANKQVSNVSQSVLSTNTVSNKSAGINGGSGGLSSAQRQDIEQRRLEAIRRRKEHSGLSSSSSSEKDRSTSGNIVNFLQPSANSTGSSASSFYSKSNQSTSKPLSSLSASLSNTKAGLGFPSTQKQSYGSKVLATFSLVSPTRFEVRTGYQEQMIKTFKTMKTGSYNAKTKVWNFDLSEHADIVRALAPLREEIQVTPLPQYILETFKKRKDYNLDNIDLSSIEQTISDSLMPFQRDGIRYAISRGGRVLIADDMGLGKTIQALGIASYYMDSWPFLVVAPSSMRYAWETAILRWFPFLSEEHITNISSGKDFVGESPVVIISYDLLSKKSKELQEKRFNLVVMDESHCIKNDKSARTKAAEPLMQKSKHLILLTGTPALSRPIELYSQISALQPNLFRYTRDFGFRYCNGQLKKIGAREVYDFSGSSNMEELSLLLQERCMIRRLKSDVLQQLPSKQRCMVLLDPTSVNSTSKLMNEKEKAARKSGVSGMEKRGLLLEWYSATAQAKLKAVQDYVTDLLSTDKKFLLFCHHQVMIAGIREILEEKGVDFIQIDGSTPSEARKLNVDRFQTSDKCQVALLSITAANSGLTLTSAQLVVFAEIYWNPGILTQAEDRAHRIGQTDSVTVQYLVAKGTADDELWPMIQKKLDVLNKAGLTKDNFQDSESKVVENKAQKKIDDFFTSDDSFPEDMFDDSWDVELSSWEPETKRLKTN